MLARVVEFVRMLLSLHGSLIAVAFVTLRRLLLQSASFVTPGFALVALKRLLTQPASFVIPGVAFATLCLVLALRAGYHIHVWLGQSPASFAAGVALSACLWVAQLVIGHIVRRIARNRRNWRRKSRKP